MPKILTGHFKLNIGSTQLNGVSSVGGLKTGAEVIKIPKDNDRTQFSIYVNQGPPEDVSIKADLIGGQKNNFKALQDLEKAHRKNDDDDPKTYTSAEIILFSDSTLETEVTRWSLKGCKLHTISISDLARDGKDVLSVEFMLSPGSSMFTTSSGSGLTGG